MLRIRYQHEAGQTLGVVIERLTDGTFFDPVAKTFGATPPATTIPLTPVGSGAWALIYRATVDSSTWADGSYAVYLVSAAGAMVGTIGQATIRGGDDAPYFPVFPKTFAVNVTS